MSIEYGIDQLHQIDSELEQVGQLDSTLEQEEQIDSTIDGAIVVLNGVQDVLVDDVSVVDENKIAHITSYQLPTASEDTLGGVKIDNETIQIDNDGTISVKDVNSAVGSRAFALKTVGWTNNQQFVGIPLDITKRNVIDVYADSVNEWAECGVIGIEESEEGIKFSCREIPSHKLYFRVVSFKVIYEHGGLTPEQLEAIENMRFYMSNGHLMVEYDSDVLDLDFSVENGNLIVENGLENDIDFEITDKNLKVEY